MKNPEHSFEPERPSEFLKIPESYKPFFVEKGGKLCDTLYTDKVEINGAIIPELFVIQSGDEIRLSDEPRFAEPNYEGYQDENGQNWTTYELAPGLEHYAVIFREGKPTYVFDNHHHALFAWQEAKEAGILKGNIALIRFDEHLDMLPGKKSPSLSRKNIKEHIEQDILDIKNFTVPALENGLIQTMYFFSGLPEKDFKEIAKKKNSANLEIQEVGALVGQNRFEDITKQITQDANSLKKLMDELKQKGYSIILDIDFDIFERPHDENLLEILAEASHIADITTCATSPLYTSQEKALERIKHMLAPKTTS